MYQYCKDLILFSLGAQGGCFIANGAQLYMHLYCSDSIMRAFICTMYSRYMYDKQLPYIVGKTAFFSELSFLFQNTSFTDIHVYM